MGSASLLLPTLVIAATGLWQSRQIMALRIWLLALALAVSLTLATKVMFLGWGVGSAAFDFTGISGHTLLATSVLQVLFSELLAAERCRFHSGGASLGLLLGLAVGASRVALGAHSISEVISAWLLGLIVSGVTLDAMEGSRQRRWFARLSPLALIFALGTTLSSYLPTHEWEIRLSLLLSGHAKPYTRQHLTSPQKIGSNSGCGQVA